MTATPRGASRARAWWTLAVMLGVVQPVAAARWLLERPQVTLTTELSHTLEKRTGSFNDKREETSVGNHELEVRSRGWYYHPALVVFEAALRPEYRAQDIAQEGVDQTRKSKTRFFGFTLDSTWLQFKPYSLRLHANRDRSVFDNNLSSDTSRVTSDYLAELSLKYQALPTVVTLEREENSSRTNFRSEDLTHTASLESRHETDHTRTALNLSYSLGEQESREQRSESGRLKASVGNNLELSKRARVNSSASYSANDSTLIGSTKTATMFSNLNVQHRDNLRSWVGMRLLSLRTTQQIATDYHADTGFEHKLFENLTTQASLASDHQAVKEGRLDSNEGTVSLQYLRRLPWGDGRIRAHLGRGIRFENDRRTGPVEIPDERLALSGLDRTFLAEDDIAGESIEVFTADRLSRFVEGIDYVVSRIGRRTAIARSVGSAIGDGDTVSVRYRFEPDPPAKTRQRSLGFGASITMFDLTVGYDRSETRESFLSGTPPDELADEATDSFRIEYRRTWTITTLEYHSRESARTPLESWGASERISLQPSRALSVDLSGSYQGDRDRLTDDFTLTTEVLGGLRWTPSRGAFLSVTAGSRIIRGDTQGSREKFAEGALDWRFGAWKPRLTLRYLHRADDVTGQVENRNGIFFELVRELDFRRYR